MAQQGGIGSQLAPIPERPLLFPRHLVFGLDLRDRASADANAWLSQVDVNPLALVLLPVDADIVAALTSENDVQAGLDAIATLIGPENGSTIGLCLRQPVTPLPTGELATIVVDALRSTETNRLAYISTCDPRNSSWHQALSEALELEDAPASGSLLPLASGAPIRLSLEESFDAIQPASIRDFSGDSYAIPVIPVNAPLTADQVAMSVDALTDAAQLALIGLRPAPNIDAAAFMGSIVNVRLGGDTLPEGFSRFDASAITLGGNWMASKVGTGQYAMTTEAGATIQTSFIGTSIWLVGLDSPDGGGIQVWIDEPAPADPATADRAISFESSQARNTSIAVATDLPAAKHTITIRTTGGQVAIAGLVVRGQPESVWSRALGSVGLIAVAIAALTVLGLSEVYQIRRRTQPPPRDVDTSAHPREFRREY